MTYICAPIFVDLPLDNGVTVEFAPSLAPVVPIPGGPKGLDGVSPIITVTDILGGHKVTITDKDGTETFDVMDGGISQEDFLKVFPQDIASGSIASFPDGADGVPVVDLTVDITPVQDLHGQSNPYPPGGGVNKLPPMVDGTYERNGVKAVVSNGVATLSGTTTASGNALIIPLQSSYTFVGGEYLHLGNSAAGSWQPSFENASNPAGGVTAAVSPANRIVQVASGKAGYEVTRIRFYLGNGVTLSGTFAPMICADNTARAYAPYSNVCSISGWSGANVHVSPTLDPDDGVTYTFDLDGVRYGGTLNVLTGVLTVTKANIASYAGETLPGEWISDRDVYAPGTTPTTGAQVVYDLATPQTVQLTPQEVETLLGVNNIWSDTGNTTVKYRADTGLYVQKLTGSTEEDMTANVSISSGKYFMVGNTLYLSTTAIPAGDTIKPGTNCTLTNLAAALNALNS